MTNLYDILRKIKAQADKAVSVNKKLGESDNWFASITTEELDWITNYLKPADMELHFKAAKIDQNEQGEPIYSQHFQIVGEGVDVFCLLTEAMLQNHQFADQVVAAASFYREHVPKCLDCQKRHFSLERPVLNWKFLPHKPLP